MVYFKNQKVNISETNGTLKIVNKQNISTPGIYFKLRIGPKDIYKIQFTGYKRAKGKVLLWISDLKYKVVEFSTKYSLGENSSTIIYYLKNKTQKTQIYNVGLLFRYGKRNDYFTINHWSFDKLHHNIIPGNIFTNKRSSHLYIYKYPSLLKNELRYFMDCMSISNITETTVKHYKTLIIDDVLLKHKKMNIVQKCPDIGVLGDSTLQLNKTYHISYHIPSEHFFDHKNRKIYDIAIIDSSHPFIHRLKKLFSANKKINIKLIPNKIKDRELSNIVNSSWITISISPDLLKSYLEISASGAVVAGDMPEQYKPIWKNNYINLVESMSDRTIVNRLYSFLSDKKLLKIMINNMNRTVNSNFTYKQYALKVLAICLDNDGEIKLRTNKLFNIDTVLDATENSELSIYHWYKKPFYL